MGPYRDDGLGWAADRLGFRAISPVFDGAEEDEIEAELGRAWMIDTAWDEITERAWAWLNEEEYDTEYLEDDDEARRLYINHWLGQSSEYDVERLA
ncbi:MAG TPA: hypothetical protein VK972_02100, partial [Wenzhouxiangella sp.]|nr:hypothetical protein [Wenzhouxiangella sp.]